MEDDEDQGGTDAHTDNSRSRWSRRTVIASIAGVVGVGAGAFLLADQTATATEARERFKNLHSGKFLEVTGGNIDNGDNVRQWAFTGSVTQQWTAIPLSTYSITKAYVIENMYSGKVLQVAGKGTNNGDNVVLWDWTGGDHQKWFIKTRDWIDGHLVIENKHSGKVLEIAGGSTKNGANVQQWEETGNENQYWVPENIRTSS